MNVITTQQPTSIATRVLVLAYIAYRSYTHRSLTIAGISAALVTGLIHSLPPDSLYLTLIVTFFLTSSKATKYKEEIKAQKTKVASANKDQSQRTYIQVFANSINASILLLILIFTTNTRHQDILRAGIIGQYAAVTADTWSSELGILSKSSPFLVTTFKTAPPGTNGAVSLTGLAAGLGGSALIGLVSILTADFNGSNKLLVWIYFALVGLAGSIIDSVLGAYLQSSVVDTKDGLIIETVGGVKLDADSVKDIETKKIVGHDVLSNNGVNLLMAATTTVLSMIGYSLLF